MVPAVTDTWRRQAPHNQSPRVVAQALWPPQVGHENPWGQRRANRYCRQVSSVENRRSNATSVRG